MSKTNVNTFRNQPDEAGRFGIHGGRFVAETLMPLILKKPTKKPAPINHFNVKCTITKSIILVAQVPSILPSA